MLTRREFLKLAALSASAKSVENWLSLSPDSQAIAAIDHLTALPETPDNLRLYQAWFKYFLAGIYAASQGNMLTAYSAHHFLFGNGTTWNITYDLEKHLLSPLGPYHGTLTNPDLAWRQYAENTLQDSLTRFSSLALSTPKWQVHKKIVENKPIPWLVNGTTLSTSPDLDNTLQRYHVAAQGRIFHSAVLADGSFELLQTNTRFFIWDQYDWNKTDGSIGGQVTSLTLIGDLLRPFLGPARTAGVINKLFATQYGRSLASPLVTLSADDAHLLQDHGLAKPYLIKSDVRNIPQTLKLVLPRDFFQKYHPAPAN